MTDSPALDEVAETKDQLRLRLWRRYRHIMRYSHYGTRETTILAIAGEEFKREPGLSIYRWHDIVKHAVDSLEAEHS